MTVMLDIGGTLHPMVSDDTYLESHGGVFEPDTVKLLRTLARGTVYDVGANVGCTALLFAAAAERVHAFEPSPSTFRYLVENTAACRNVIAHNVGLAERKRRSEITFAAANRSGGFVSDLTQACEGHVTEAIELRKMDAYCKKLPPPDFIKIDVEGFELNVLAGAPRILRKYRPVVTLEMNHWCLNAFRRTSIPEFMDRLRAIFPKLYAVQGDEYLDLHDAAQSYKAMYHHILSMKFASIVGAFNDEQLAPFHAGYRRVP